MLKDIAARNSLRAEAQLPLLAVEAEMERMERVQSEAEFQLVWQRQKHRFSHLWLRNTDGWIANMRRNYITQNRIREEWMRGEHSAHD